MATLWNRLNRNGSLNEQVQKNQSDYSDFDIAEMYCKTAMEYGESQKMLELLISIGEAESGFNPRAGWNKKSCSSGLQQVQSVDCWKNRPTKNELLNNPLLNIQESARLLKYFNMNPMRYNGNPIYKIKYNERVRRSQKMIKPILDGVFTINS